MFPPASAAGLVLLLTAFRHCPAEYVEPCLRTCSNSSLPNFFQIEYDDAGRATVGAESRSVPNAMLTCEMKRVNAPRCALDVMELIDPYAGATGDEILINLSLDFSGQATALTSPPPEVIMSAYRRPRRRNIIMLFTMISLSFSWSEIDHLASMVNLVVLKLVDCTVAPPPAATGGGAEPRQPLNNLWSIMTLGLTVSRGGSGVNESINSWLPADVEFPFMAEFHVVCAGLRVDPRGSKNSNILQNVVQVQTCSHQIDLQPLFRAMPRLQALELTNFTSVTSIPLFPWYPDTLRLPSNLSRTAFFHSHYTNKNSLIIDRNIYRRMLVVRGGNITRADGCGFFHSVDRIDLDQNGLVEVAEDCFLNATSLQYLKLNGNRLESLGPRVFSALSNLTKLYLHNNYIARLDDAVFRSLTSLQYLNLAYNRLTAIGGSLFKNLVKLRYLSLRNNLIAAIETSAFPVGSTELNYLLLGGNKLTDLPLVAFHIRNTLVFELSDNEITFEFLNRTVAQINVDSIRVYSVESISDFDDVNQLSTQSTRTKIDLRRNKVHRFPTDALGPAELSNLGFVSKWFELDLDGNPVACDCHAYRLRKDLLSVGAPEGSFDSWKCDTPLDVRGIGMFSAPSKAFSCAQQMPDCPAACECRLRTVDNATIVDCSNRSLTEFPSSLPKPMAGSELIVDFRNNKINILPAADSLSSVSALLLSGNSLKSVEEEAIERMTTLRELQLDNNRLTTLPLNIRNVHLDRLSLRANYWPCDCRNDWMKAWLQRERAVVEDLYQVTCSSTRTSVRGLPITEVNDNDFVCVDDQYELKVTLGILVTLLLVIIVVVGLTYKYFSTIKIILYAKFYWHPFDRIDEEDSAKKYDVFISYSNFDSDWVLGILCNVLETRTVPPLKTCVHDKDFTVGCSIHDNITASVRLSRRMVVVLSKSFVRSEWCMLEFRTAHEKVMKEHSPYLVVILLDDVDVDMLDDSLKGYLSTNTYLHVSNRWFWNKLLYVMPQRTKPRLHPDLPPAFAKTAGAATVVMDTERMSLVAA